MQWTFPAGNTWIRVTDGDQINRYGQIHMRSVRAEFGEQIAGEFQPNYTLHLTVGEASDFEACLQSVVVWLANRNDPISRMEYVRNR